MMKQPSLRLADTPLLSDIEAAETLRRLPLVRQIAYFTVTTLVTLLALALAVALSSVLMAGLLNLLLAYAFTVDNLLMFAFFPVVLAYLLALGISAQAHTETVKPHESLPYRTRQALRHGLYGGVIVGFVFGCVWYFVVYIGVIYIDLNTIFDTGLSVMDFITFGLTLALAVAPLMALYRVLVTVIGPVTLHRLRRAAP